MVGIWDDPELEKHNYVPKNIQLSLGEANTPLIMVELPGRMPLAVKDENQNPNGSFKDRSLAYQISCYLESGRNRFVISSSGNAAIAAAAIVALAREQSPELEIFISPRANPLKLEKLKSIVKTHPRMRIHVSDQAKSAAMRCVANDPELINLRGSMDDLALPGFKTIAYELAREYPQLDAVFVPCSSGTSALGLIQGFSELGKKVAVFICQTTKVHPLAALFDQSFIASHTSLADAITDRVAQRKAELVTALKACHGGGFVISDGALHNVRHELAEAGHDYSYNSLLGFAGYFKMIDNNFKHPVIIASGL